MSNLPLLGKWLYKAVVSEITHSPKTLRPEGLSGPVSTHG